MNAKTNLTLLLLAALTALASAADKPQPALSVAVYDFTGDAEAAGYAGKATSLVTADLTTETNLVVLERADLNKVLNEQAFGISGMVSADAAAKIGQVTGVKVLVAGQAIKTDGNHLVIVANIIGTETGRLFAAKVEGSPDNLMPLTADLSRQIARIISAQATNLMAPAAESHEERVARIVNSIKGKNRPSVSVDISAYNGLGNSWRDTTSTSELANLLLKAGFPVVDENSDKKPDVIITGTTGVGTGLPRGELVTGRVLIELKVQERRTGDILCCDHQEATAIDIGVSLAGSAAGIKATDELAERILPLLAK